MALEEQADSLMEGMLTRPQLAKALNRSERTVIRYEGLGMPVIRRGTLRLYEIVAVRAWLRGDRQPRKRGLLYRRGA